ncbi:MAG: aminofutalosine synthase MqnE [Nitrospinae bacterium]|nr:aminofutalosine synthase MqnE [Nitrospinota bacterium]
MGMEEIRRKVEAGERLSFDDGLFLMNSPDLLSLGKLADTVRRRKNRNRAHYIVNSHINHTNICVNKCRFCAFQRAAGEEGAYTMALDEVMREAEKGYAPGISEFHIVGGLHPDLPYSYYREMIARLHETYPQVHLQAFTAVEIDYFARISGMGLREVLTDLKEAGLGSLPGGGAEIFAERTRQRICPDKISGGRWLEVMETAHGAGLRSNATMLYGHIESAEERIDHLVRLRELQDKTGGFMAFIPLAFHPLNTDLDDRQFTTGQLDIRMLAVSRLMLDNFDHIKAFWIMISPQISQLSLFFGADDIDGTVVEEKITNAAGAQSGKSLSVSRLEEMIREAGMEPVRRDTLYNAVAAPAA